MHVFEGNIRVGVKAEQPISVYLECFNLYISIFTVYISATPYPFHNQRSWRIFRSGDHCQGVNALPVSVLSFQPTLPLKVVVDGVELIVGLGVDLVRLRVDAATRFFS